MALRHKTRMLWDHGLSGLQQKVNDFLVTMEPDIDIKDIKFQAEPATPDEDSGYSALIWYTFEEESGI